MKIELADHTNFNYDSLDGFSRYQEVKNIYRVVNGELTLVNRPFTEDWDLERRREKAADILAGDEMTYCAFDGGRVVGAIMLIPKLDKGRMIIDSFHVSYDHRRCGIGRALFAAAADAARRAGAAGLYVSACPSQETIDFYLAMGFRVSADPIAACVEEEPGDIQMECAL